MSVAEKLNDLITEARSSCLNPDSQPEIRHSVLQLDDLSEDIKFSLMCRGLADAIRSYLKKFNGDEMLSEEQLSLWPSGLHDTVADINRARVFVPSRREYVALSPNHISPSEAREAGEYLVQKGQDCIRVGNQLIDLSNRNW